MERYVSELVPALLGDAGGEVSEDGRMRGSGMSAGVRRTGVPGRGNRTGKGPVSRNHGRPVELKTVDSKAESSGRGCCKIFEGQSAHSPMGEELFTRTSDLSPVGLWNPEVAVDVEKENSEDHA